MNTLVVKRAMSVAGVALMLAAPVVVHAEASSTGGAVNTPRCSAAATAIDSRVKIYSRRGDEAEAALDRINKRLANIIGRADARGYDVSKLQADQSELQRRVGTISSDYAQLLTAISDARAKCGAAGSLAAARTRVHVLHGDTENVKAWIQNTLKPDMTALKSVGHK